LRSLFFYITLFLIVAGVKSFCQSTDDATIKPVTIPNTLIRELKSKIVGISYKLYIKLPVDYDPKKQYDIIFLLDPEYSFGIAANITDHLVQRNDMPPVVLVGIGYSVDNYKLNRTRDYTPTKTSKGGYSEEIISHSGGGESFYTFIISELFPFIDSSVGKAKTKTLVGHSYGGLFASWMLLAKPFTFDRLIIVSPSLWYDEQLMLKEAESNELTTIHSKAYFTTGSLEEKRMIGDLVRLKEIFKSRNTSFEHKIVITSDENHDTIFPTGFSKGLRYTFGLK